MLPAHLQALTQTEMTSRLNGRWGVLVCGGAGVCVGVCLSACVRVCEAGQQEA